MLRINTKRSWYCKTDFLLYFLNQIGLIEQFESNPSTKTRYKMFSMYMVLTLIDLMVMVGISSHQLDWKLVLAYTVIYFLSMAIWCAMGSKRRSLTTLVSKIVATRKTIKCIRFSNFVFCGIWGLSFLCALSASTISALNKDFSTYTYSIDIYDTSTRFLTVFIHFFLLSFMFPILPYLVTLLFCRLCHQYCENIRKLTNAIQKCPSKYFTYTFQIEMMKSKAKISKTSNQFQNAFSTSCLLLCASSFFSYCSVIANVVLEGLAALNLYTVIDVLYSGLLPDIALASLIWVAGRVPIEMAGFKNAFIIKIENRVFLGMATEDERLERIVFEKTDIVLDGGNVIQYRKNLIFTFVGTVLTYTFLLFSTNATKCN